MSSILFGGTIRDSIFIGGYNGKENGNYYLRLRD